MNRVIVVLILIIAAAGGSYLYQLTKQQQKNEHILEYGAARLLNSFSLTNQHGKSFGNEQLKAHWSFVFLGYTSCPDVCPTTMQALNFIYPQLKEIDSRAQVVLVSVDPKRDSVDKLAQYVSYFNPEFFALRGDHDALFPFTRNLGLMYALADDSSEDYYLVDHSASIVLINPDGNISAIYKPQQELGSVPSVDTEAMMNHFKSIAQ